RVGGGRDQRSPQRRQRPGHLGLHLQARPNPEGRPESARAEKDEDGGAKQAEGKPQAGELQQRGGSGNAQRHISQIDYGRAQPDRETGGETEPQRAASAEQPDRSDFGSDQKPKPDAGQKRGQHGLRSYVK